MLENKDILRFTIPLLHYCNLSCDYCHVPNERQEYLDLEIYKKGVDFFYASPGYLKNLVLYGGEPLLLKDADLKICVDYAVEQKKLYPEKRFEITIVTNLTVFRDSLIPILEKIDNLCISIDGTQQSHDANRGMFDITYKNFQKIKKSEKIMQGATINKVVNHKNTYTFFEDVTYILDTFKLPISYNGALTVGDWDEPSVKELYLQLDMIYKYAHENNISGLFQNFFQIAMKSCPFGTLSMGLTGKVYNCEFISNDYVNNPEPVIDLMQQRLVKKNIKTCFYNYLSKDCVDENCLTCGSTCTKFSFQDDTVLSDKKSNYLAEVKNARHNHLKYFREIVGDKYDFKHNVILKNLNYQNLFKLYNYSISLCDLLFFDVFYFYADIPELKVPLYNKLFGIMIKKGGKDFKVDFIPSTMTDTTTIELDLLTGFVSKQGKYVGNIYSEMNSFL